MSREIKIAIVQDRNGKVTTCGPDESWNTYGSQMEAAFCWALEAGEIPTNKFWVTVTLPDPTDTELELDSILE